ncbi:MAG: hypothetical protein GY754_00880 [bacterium]|nr:hypothetical protein [bacterium]
MEIIKYFDSTEFTAKRLIAMKRETRKQIYVVFSTLGEREAELIYDKITLLRLELVEFIDKIFLSHRRAGDPEKEELTEQKAKKADPAVEIINCNSYNPPDMESERGKGADMRRTLYYINQNLEESVSPDDVILVFLDADVVPEHFGAHFVLGLSGAIMEGYDFSKASFWREMGRVKKFVAQPIFSIIDHPDLDKLKDFAYPLSGEVGGTLHFFNSVCFWQIYGVETGINIDSCVGSYQVADINLGLYDHEHHGDLNIQKMAFGIMRTYLTQLRDYGIIELKQGAKISDTFKAAMIDEKGNRESMEFDLTEKKYSPLKEIL